MCVPRDPGTAGMACVATAPNRVCRRVCNPTLAGSDAGAQCPAMQACTLRFNDTPEAYGACAPMP